MLWTEIGAIAAVAAAIIALVGAVIGRLNYADSELERQNRIHNRIGGRTKEIEYEKSDSSGNGLPGSVGFELNSHYDFQVTDILVTEHSGWIYLLKKIVWGFDGTVRIDIHSQRYGIAVKGYVHEAPADFDMIEEFCFVNHQVDEMLVPEDGLIRLRFPHANIDKIDQTIEDIMDFMGENLGAIPPMAYEEVHGGV